MQLNSSRILWIAFGLYFLIVVAQLVRGEASQGYSEDFSNYYYTAKAYLEGVNPYDRNAVEVANGQPLLQFFYFPLSLQIFRPLTWLSFDTARMVFLVIQCCSLIYLVFLWQSVFLKEKADPWFFLFCMLAFNATVYLDLRAGNVSTIEQALLWTSFYFFLRKRPVIFGIFLVLAAIFKMVLLFFALLILMLKRGERYAALIAVGSALSIAWVTAWLTDPQLLAQFVSHLSQTLDVASDQGIMNPASLAFFKSVSISLTARGWIEWPEFLPWPVYFCWVASVAFISWRALKNLDTSEDDGARLAINFMCLVFTLVSPRLKDYSYIILLLPTYFIIARTTVIRAYPLGFILCTLYAPQGLALPGFNLFTTALRHYYPLALAFLVWIMYLAEFHARNSVPASTDPVPALHGFEKPALRSNRG